MTPHALGFVATLEREFGARRRWLLDRRRERQAAIDAGERPTFLPATAPLRRDPGWRVAPAPDDLQDRRVEITGPTERKMMINALNSGASVFMADFEDANAPTWPNMVDGQINLRDAASRTIRFTGPDGKVYRLLDETAVLMVRPRGWHLEEKHLWVDGRAASASLFDFGLAFFHNARRLLERGSGPYFYLPKLEGHLEARLWNEVFCFAQDALGLPRGSIRATVLIETILAAFEMEEILYELRDHAAGLNAGRWDYIFSIIKKFRRDPGLLFPDRGQITMTVPFMRAYARLLVHTCHKRGAHAIGGMAAFIPSRKDAEANEVALTRVRDDKRREAADGFDGTWVAHPDLVAVARQEFDHALGEQPNQKGRVDPDPAVSPSDLLDFRISGASISEAGLRNNVSVALQYLEAWLRGTGALGIFSLMEDTATAEISRAQLWQWLHAPGGATLADGRRVTPGLYRSTVAREVEAIRAAQGGERVASATLALAERLLDELATRDDFDEFLTLRAYDHLD